MMKIALIGSGKMGQCIAELAAAKSYPLTAQFSSTTPLSQETEHLLKEADCVIDFSSPHSILTHVEICMRNHKPLVIGTTGWNDKLQQIQQCVKTFQGSCLYAPNFSIGIYLFKKISAYAATLFAPFKEYDISGVEYHHAQKKDAPSGTALALTQAIQTHIPRLNSFSFSSVRCGHFPGTHTLLFDSEVDTIYLTHEARSRHGFASGAILAAEWLLPQTGFFTFEDMMQTYLAI